MASEVGPEAGNCDEHAAVSNASVTAQPETRALPIAPRSPPAAVPGRTRKPRLPQEPRSFGNTSDILDVPEACYGDVDDYCASDATDVAKARIGPLSTMFRALPHSFSDRPQHTTGSGRKT